MVALRVCLMMLTAWRLASAQPSGARVVADRQLALTGTALAADLCVAFLSRASAGLLIAVEPVITAAESGECTGTNLWPIPIILRPEIGHEVAVVGPVSRPNGLFWLELKLLPGDLEQGEITVSIWSEPRRSSARPAVHRDLEVYRTSLDTAALKTVVNTGKYVLVAVGAAHLIRGGLTLIRIGHFLVEEGRNYAVAVVVKRGIDGVAASREQYWVRDHSCGQTTRIIFNAAGEAMYSGPSGCHQGIRLRRLTR